MPQHEKKQCPRCKGGFECKSGSILLCQCSKIDMSVEQIEYCNEQYDDCLCLSCLKDLCVDFDLLTEAEKSKNNLLGRS